MNKNAGWSEDAIKPLANFGTIKQFWGMYQHLKRPSQLQNTVLNIFLQGIKPAWEAPEHAKGGEWVIRVNKGHANILWENLLLGFIGEQFTLEN